MCSILGGGPSLSKVELSRLRGARTIAVNCACADVPWAEVMFFGDGGWIEHHADLLRPFGGLIFTHREELVQREQDCGVLILRREPKRLTDDPGICKDPRFIVWNWNSGAAAINLAVHLGAAKIVLFGFDMRVADGRGNYHDHYGGHQRNKPFHVFLGSDPGQVPVFPAIARDCAALGVEVVNATPGSAITCWPIVEPSTITSALAWEGEPDKQEATA